MTGPIIKSDIDQLSPAWHELHGSVPSASNFHKIITTRGEPSKQAKDYMLQLAGTRVFGVFEDSYTSWSMQIGIDREKDAKELFELITGNTLKDVGFVYYDERLDRGASPDSMVNDSEVLELKSPLLKTHVKYLLDDKLPTDYFTQCQGELYCTHSEKLYFVSYFPDTPLFIHTVNRDEGFISKLDKALDEFNQELNGICEKLKQ